MEVGIKMIRFLFFFEVFKANWVKFENIPKPLQFVGDWELLNFNDSLQDFESNTCNPNNKNWNYFNSWFQSPFTRRHLKDLENVMTSLSFSHIYFSVSFADILFKIFLGYTRFRFLTYFPPMNFVVL